ncbi:MAG: poly[(R)-3-hydroxyalkanoate] polymerase subunit PhaC [Thermoleophilaceae bacterium]|nr:poly[(R)-3-hydroxyalkanoate] polymerase subunit PhaC [Thermoleophilaceae bacterium]
MPSLIPTRMPRLLPSIDSVVNAAANVWDMSPLGSGLADRTRTPTHVIDEGPQRTVHRYRPTRRRRWHAPVLLVPPLAAPASCFDLWRGSSLAAHLLALGYPAYLLDYGPIAFSDRQLGIEHWVDDVIPNAVRAVSEDSDGLPVQVVGWCLGGIMATLAAAGNDLPVRSVTMVASPFDFEKVRTMAPIRRLAELTGGRLVTSLYSALGGAPAPLVSLGFQVTALDKRITKPLFTLQHLGDRELLAHVEAVDDYMAHMLAYPGRTFAQLYHRFFRVNDLADGRIDLGDRCIDIAALDVPVLVVAGKNDVLAPAEAVTVVEPLLTGAPSVRVELAPGGHLGVLTGRGARETTWRVLDEFLGVNDVEHAVVEQANRRAEERERTPAAA